MRVKLRYVLSNSNDSKIPLSNSYLSIFLSSAQELAQEKLNNKYYLKLMNIPDIKTVWLKCYVDEEYEMLLTVEAELETEATENEVKMKTLSDLEKLELWNKETDLYGLFRLFSYEITP